MVHINKCTYKMYDKVRRYLNYIYRMLHSGPSASSNRKSWHLPMHVLTKGNPKKLLFLNTLWGLLKLGFRQNLSPSHFFYLRP